MRHTKHTRTSLLSLRRPARKGTRRGPNFKHEKKTQPELDFEQRFLFPMQQAGQIYGLHFHALRFNAGLGSWYEPDFTALDSEDNRLLVYEVKGPHVYEDSTVKFKACALLYPWVSWTWAERDSAGNWIVLPANPSTPTPPALDHNRLTPGSPSPLQKLVDTQKGKA